MNNGQAHRPLTRALLIQKSKTSDYRLISNLNLWGLSLGDVSILEQVPNIEILSLTMNCITTMKPFQNCKRLQQLFLRKNSIRNLSELSYLKDLPNLRNFSLSDNPCAERPDYRLTVIKELPQLDKLDNQEISPEERRQAQSIQTQSPMGGGSPVGRRDEPPMHDQLDYEMARNMGRDSPPPVYSSPKKNKWSKKKNKWTSKRKVEIGNGGGGVGGYDRRRGEEENRQQAHYGSPNNYQKGGNFGYRKSQTMPDNDVEGYDVPKQRYHDDYLPSKLRQISDISDVTTKPNMFRKTNEKAAKSPRLQATGKDLDYGGQIFDSFKEHTLRPIGRSIMNLANKDKDRQAILNSNRKLKAIDLLLEDLNVDELRYVLGEIGARQAKLRA